MNSIDIDLFGNYFITGSSHKSEYPKIVEWLSPDYGGPRHRVLRDSIEEANFLDWFNHKYPDVTLKNK
jgi:hypothetical protein